MPVLIDYECPECGAHKEELSGKRVLCWCKASTGVLELLGTISTEMQPIFSPKNNGQRWRHNDD